MPLITASLITELVINVKYPNQSFHLRRIMARAD